MSEAEQIKRLREEVTILNQCLRQKNLALDAMHYVWCDGGCAYGVHRWSDFTISEALVVEVEKEARRLRRWWDTYQYKLKHYPERCRSRT